MYTRRDVIRELSLTFRSSAACSSEPSSCPLMYVVRKEKTLGVVTNVKRPMFLSATFSNAAASTPLIFRLSWAERSPDPLAIDSAVLTASARILAFRFGDILTVYPEAATDYSVISDAFIPVGAPPAFQPAASLPCGSCNGLATPSRRFSQRCPGPCDRKAGRPRPRRGDRPAAQPEPTERRE